MPTLKTLQQVSEYDILPFYTWSGALPVNKGTVVKIVGSGLMNQALTTIGNAGAAYNGTYSPRWSVVPQVATVNSTGDRPIGILLYDGRETDENGEQLKFRPRKAAEMQCFISGQAVPIATRGIFQYSGVSGTVTAGSPVYINNIGELATTGPADRIVGVALGSKDANGYVNVKLNFENV